MDVRRVYNSMAVKDSYGNISLCNMPYQNDYFKFGVLQNIREGNLATDEKKKLLIVSIPFYRNIFEYIEENVDSDSSSYMFLTCCMHMKEKPQKTEEIMLSDIFGKEFHGKKVSKENDEFYLDALSRIAKDIVENAGADLKLEDKFVLSIYCRLRAEIYMKSRFPDECIECNKNQTRKWFNTVKNRLDHFAMDTIERALMISPVAIHVNSFMYEPLIDVSGWELVNLCKDIITLSTCIFDK